MAKLKTMEATIDTFRRGRDIEVMTMKQTHVNTTWCRCRRGCGRLQIRTSRNPSRGDRVDVARQNGDAGSFHENGDNGDDHFIDTSQPARNKS